jgi:hypothetical protein
MLLAGPLVLACAAMLASAAPSEAAKLETNCGGLQGAIEAVSERPEHGAGEVVVLNGMCEAANLKTSTGVEIPAESNITIEGAPGTTSGLDGTGVTKSMLSTKNPAGAIALTNLTFRNANITAGGGLGAAVTLTVTHLALAHDDFVGNTLHGAAGAAAFVDAAPPKGGCPSAASGAPPEVSITDTTFTDNNLISEGDAAGGGLDLLLACGFPGAVLERDAFEGNTVETTAPGSALALAVGGGLAVESGASAPAPRIVQRGNLFDSNSVLSPAAHDVGGGGEWSTGLSVSSTGDRFSRNSIPGTSDPWWSWGAGIAVRGCVSTTATEDALVDDVVSGNRIGSGTAAATGGAGVYVGCPPSSTQPNHLGLFDSTVTENSVTGAGVAGVGGGPEDHLQVINSIVANDLGGPELGGFNGPGAALGVSFSDVCTAGSSSPLGGEGNICADPRLTNDGNAASFDVHETSASPTREMGSNALVPSGLANDFFGGPRIAGGVRFEGCDGGPGTLEAPVVDIGAAEDPEASVGLTPCPLLTRVRAFLAFPTITDGTLGRLKLRFKQFTPGTLTIQINGKLTRLVVSHGNGKRHVRRVTTDFSYGSRRYTSKTGKPVTIALTPTAHALALLRRHRHLGVRIAVALNAAGLAPNAQSRAITIVYKAPPKHHGHRRG